MDNSLSATDSYLNLMLSLPNLDPTTALSVFFLTLARILPLMTLAPFLGAKNLPMVLRMMFGLALVAIFLPQNMLTIRGPLAISMPFIGLMLKELLLGTILGFLAATPFYIAQMSGSLIDHSRGSSALQVTDPTTQSQTGPIGILYNYVLIAVFFALGGPFLFFNGVADSYLVIPVDGLISPLFFNKNLPIWKQLFDVAERLFDLSIQLAAPALIGLLFTDLFLGIANRLAPQVQIVFLGMSLKSWVGIALLTAAWALIIQTMGKESIAWIKLINGMISSFGVK
jgi:type III secretory pathway component EscT